MSQQPDIILRVPLPNVEVDEQHLYQIKEAFRREHLTIKLSAEDEFPVAGSWAELAIAAASFLTGVAVTHYLDMVLDAFDAFVK